MSRSQTKEVASSQAARWGQTLIYNIMLSLTCRVFGSGFLAQQGSLASCEVVVEQSRAQDYSGQQVEVFQVRM